MTTGRRGTASSSVAVFPRAFTVRTGLMANTRFVARSNNGAQRRSGKSISKILKLTWEHFLHGVRNVPLPVNTVGEEALQKRLGGLAIAPVKGSVAEGAYFGRELALKENNRGIRSIRLDREGEGWKCTLVTRAGENAFPVGCGVWAKGTIRIDKEKYEKPGDLSEAATAASGA